MGEFRFTPKNGLKIRKISSDTKKIQIERFGFFL